MGRLWVRLKNQLRMLTFYRRLVYSYTAIMAVGLVLFAATMYWGITGAIRTQVLEQSAETLRQAQSNLEDYMADIDTLMLNITANSAVQAQLADKAITTDQAGNLSAQRVREQFSGDVFLHKTNGAAVFALQQPHYPPYTPYSTSWRGGYMANFGVYRGTGIQQEAYYRQVVDHGSATLWLAPGDEAGAGEDFSANRLLLSTKNLKEALGLVRVFVPQSRFSNIVGEVSFGFSGSMLMVAGDRLVGEVEGLSQDYRAQLLAQAATLADGVAQVEIDGAAIYLITSTLPATNWKLVGLIPAEKLMDRYQFVNQITLLVLVAFLLATLVFVWSVSSSISKPIRQVAGAMRDFDERPDFRFSQTPSGDVGVLFESFNRMMDRIDSLLEETRQHAATRRKAELRALQAQINPHFLYNTLDCIRSLATTGSAGGIADMTVALSDFYRGTLSGGRELLSLRGEIALTRSYCAVVRYRSQTPFELAVEVDEGLMELPVIKLILQPLVENAILHGFAGIGRPGRVGISADYDGELLVLRVEDNGEGGDAEYLNGVLSGEYRRTAEGSSSGYGIYSVQERIRLMFGADSGLAFEENETGGITAVIRLRPGNLREEEGYGKAE